MKERLRINYESMENFVQMLAATNSKVFDFQLHIMITADSQEELDAKEDMWILKYESLDKKLCQSILSAELSY